MCSHDLVVTGIWGAIEAELHKIKERGIHIAFDFADNVFTARIYLKATELACPCITEYNDHKN